MSGGLLVLVVVGVVTAVRSDQAVRPTTAGVGADLRSAEIRQRRADHDADGYGCDTHVVVAVRGADPGPEQWRQTQRDTEAMMCTTQIAADPQRVLLSPPQQWDGEARNVHAALDRALCSAGLLCGEVDPVAPIEARRVTDADVAAVRLALDGIGFSDAEVRPVQPGDGGPRRSVMYGVPLGGRACAVSHVIIGERPGRLGAVGALTTGRCLRPAVTGRPG